MFIKAGEVYAEYNMFELAAHNYLKANRCCEAGKYFEKAEKYDAAAHAYKCGRFYDDAVKFMLK